MRADVVFAQYICPNCSRLHASFVYRSTSDAMEKLRLNVVVQEIDPALREEFSNLFEI